MGGTKCTEDYELVSNWVSVRNILLMQGVASSITQESRDTETHVWKSGIDIERSERYTYSLLSHVPAINSVHCKFINIRQ